MNSWQNQEKSQTSQQTSIDLQQDYICYSSDESISREELSCKLQQLTTKEANHLGYALRVSKHGEGYCYAASDTFQAHGAGCRETQQNTREKLQSLGLLTVYDRIEWGTPFRRPPIQVVASYLFDEANAYILKQFCGIPFFFPISVLKMLKSVSLKQAPGRNLTELLKEFIYTNSSSLSNFIRRKNYEDQQAAKRKIKFVKNQEKSHQGGSCKPVDKPATYGGTGLYDRQTSQKELQLRNNIHERQKRKYAMESDSESQPRYNEPTLPRRQCAANASSMRCEDPVAASERLVSWTQSEQYKKFAALFGEEMAFKMCNKIVSQAIEGTKE